MKKVLVFFIFIFVCVFSLIFIPKVSANDDTSYDNSLKDISEISNVDIIHGERDISKIIDFYNAYTSYLGEINAGVGYVEAKREIISDGITHTLSVIVNTSRKYVTTYRAFIDDVLFYYVVLSNNPTFIKDNDIYLTKEDSNYYIDGDFTLSEKSFDASNIDLKEYCILPDGFKNDIEDLIYVKKIKEIDSINIKCDTLNIPDISTIVLENQIEINNELLETFIYSNNLDNKEGNYLIKLYAIDDDIYIKNIYVEIKNDDEIILNLKNDYIELNYDEKLLDEDILKLIDYNDLSLFKIEIDKTNIDYSKIGSYEIYINIWDKYERKQTLTLILNVVDKIAPVIIGNNMTVNKSMPLTLTKILSKIEVIDKIDGIINREDIEVLDLDDYFINSNVLGTYRFLITAKDKSGNVASQTYLVKVCNDVSELTVNYYIIYLSNQSVVTKEEILDFLINKGYVSDDNSILESQYFLAKNPEGRYKLNIIDSTGKVDEYTISLEDNIDYVAPKEELIDVNNTNNSNHQAIITTIIISSILITGIIIITIISYKKRH